MRSSSFLFVGRRFFDLAFDNLSILVESALYALHSAARADPELFAHHPDESFVVRDEHDTAAVLSDALPERFDRLNVQVIRRFVKNEEVWHCWND